MGSVIGFVLWIIFSVTNALYWSWPTFWMFFTDSTTSLHDVLCIQCAAWSRATEENACLVLLTTKAPDSNFWYTLGWRNWATLHNLRAPVQTSMASEQQLILRMSWSYVWADHTYELIIRMSWSYAYVWADRTYELIVRMSWSYVWTDRTYELIVRMSWSYVWTDRTYELIVRMSWSYVWADRTYELIVHMSWSYIWAEFPFPDCSHNLED